MKIFVYCFREFDEKEFFDKFSKKYNVEYDYTEQYPSYENAVLAEGYDAISFTVCNMDKNIIKRFYEMGVRYLSARSIGFDHIDIEYARSLGIGVSNVSYPPDTVAEFTIMLMLMSCKKITHILKRSDVQDFTLKGKIGKNLGECTVGIVGTGHIGKAVIKKLSGFGCKVMAYDPFKSCDVNNMAEYVSFDTLIKESDIISLHTPATKENYHLLNSEAFNKMKDGVIVVNTARGSLIDTNALINAIEKGKVYGAALDVIEEEAGLYYADRVGDCIANREMAVLRSFPNVIVTPHTAFYSRTVVSDMAEKAVKAVLDMKEGRENSNIIV